MTDKTISPLRRRMIEDMTIRKFAPKTQASYIRAVRNLTVFLGRAPDRASAEELRRYQLHLASGGVSVPTMNATVTALRFFFQVTLGHGEATEKMPFVREPRKLPVILSLEEVARFLEAAPRYDWGVNVFRPLRGGLPEDFPYHHAVVMEIDKEKGPAHWGAGVNVPLAPFFGNFGVAPPARMGRVSLHRLCAINSRKYLQN